MAFGSKRRQRERMEFLQNFRPTSKYNLKQMCQWYCNGDFDKAQEMYDFYTKDIELPDFDPIPPTWQKQFKDNANGIIDWIKQNQNTLSQGYEFFRQIIANKGKLPAIMGVEEEIAENEPLPSIN